MIVYRLEYKDGGGPWFHRDGRPRDGVILPKFEIENLGYLFGFDSLDNLIEYKNAHKDEISFIDIKIKKYLVSKARRTNKEKGVVVFYEKDIISTL